ncbi:hypothetical protein ACJ73_10363, partial [Blastomyces percursus]
RTLHEARPRLPPRLLHNLRLVPLRTRRTPRTNHPHQRRRECPHRHRRQQIRPRGRPRRLAVARLRPLPTVGKLAVLRNFRPPPCERQRGLHRLVSADYPQGYTGESGAEYGAGDEWEEWRRRRQWWWWWWCEWWLWDWWGRKAQSTQWWADKASEESEGKRGLCDFV